MATALEIIKDVCKEIGVEVPTAVFGQTDRELLELAATANTVAEMVLESHDWQELKTLHTITGNGTLEDFALPADYHRMPKDQRIWSSVLQAPLTHIISTDHWLELDIRDFEPLVGYWIIYGDQIHIKPAMSATATAKFFYISNKVVTAADASKKATFTADTDTFRLGDRLLRTGMIWKWKANKGLAYGEDLADFEDALADKISNDKGARVLKLGRQRLRVDAQLAYPKSIISS